MILMRRLARTLIVYTAIGSLVIFALLTLQSRKSISDRAAVSKDRLSILDTCIGSTPKDRICRLSNFCYDFATSQYVHHHPQFILGQYHNTTDLRFADMASVDDHNTYYWQWRTDPLAAPHSTDLRDTAPRKQVVWVDEPVHLVKRFFPVNIMHLFHDDLLGWQDVLRRVNPDIRQLWFVDDYGRQIAYESVYDWLKELGVTVKHLMEYKGAKTAATPPNPDKMVCFRDATVGTSKRYVWYQYGYKDKQSPIKHAIQQHHLADAFDWFRARANVTIPAHFYKTRQRAFRAIANNRRFENTAADLQITVFTRSKTRLLINTGALIGHLEREFGLPVRRVGLEGMSIGEVIRELSKSAVAIGLHGSLLVMAGFMPPGGVLIEGFPYAVPPGDYQPYREMCRVLGHRYGAWASPHPQRPHTVGHQDRGKHEGGLKHLPKHEQRAILEARWIKPHRCCYDAAWLYRIFQDTAVDTQDIVDLVRQLVDA